MKLHFLGTGAADWPNPGKTAGTTRRLTAMLMNGHILIDCGTTTLDAIEEFGVDVNGLDAIAVSHPHSDHFDMATIDAILSRRAPGLPPVQLFVNPAAAKRCPSSLPPCKLEVHGYLPGDSFLCGNVIFRTFPANHPLPFPDELPAHFLIEDEDGKRLLYLPDGAWLPKQTWYALKETPKPLDAVIWEITCGILNDYRVFEHCNLEMITMMAAVFRNYGLIENATRMFCTHLMMDNGMQPALLARATLEHGITLAQDNMRVDI